MSLGEVWERARPRYEVPSLPKMSAREKTALLIGTGLGCGFAKPCAPSLASIPGFALFILVIRLPLGAALAIFAALLLLAVWSGSICERLLGRKDPRPVVIDEIAAVPFALCPLLIQWPQHLPTWLVLFAVYRFADYIKPYPANSLQNIHGGLGILIDDIISSTYMGVALWAWILYFPHTL